MSKTFIFNFDFLKNLLFTRAHKVESKQVSALFSCTHRSFH